MGQRVPIPVILQNREHPTTIDEADLFSERLSIVALAYDEKWCAELMCDADLVAKIPQYYDLLKMGHAPSAEADRHPCVEWLLDSMANYQWLYAVALSMQQEYNFRQIDKPSLRIAAELLKGLSDHPSYVASGKSTIPSPPPQCVPELYRTNERTKRWENVIRAFWQYYIHEKPDAVWTNRETPHWYVMGVHQIEQEAACAFAEPSGKPKVKPL